MVKEQKTINCLDLKSLILVVIPTIVEWITLGIFIYKAFRYLSPHVKRFTKSLFITKSYPSYKYLGKTPHYATRYVTKFLGIIKIKEKTWASHKII